MNGPTGRLNTSLIYKFKEFALNGFARFSQETVLHGFYYIGDRRLPAWHRLFFLSFWVTILVYLLLMSMNIYHKWQQTPVIVGYSSEQKFIDKIPFPTITICNVNQILASKAQKFRRYSLEHSMLQTICPKNNKDVNELPIVKNRTMLRNFIFNNAQPCEDLLISCRFGSTQVPCSQMFIPNLKDEGLCCKFNYMHPTFVYRKYNGSFNFPQSDGHLPIYWDPEDGFKEPVPRYFYPRKALGTGIRKGLTVILNAGVKDYYCSTTLGQGFKILIHNPLDMPSLRQNGLSARIGSETNFHIIPRLSEASQNIRDFKIEQRHCLFKTERELLKFKIYTHLNCKAECLANVTALSCGCISYFLPQTLPNVPVCGFQDETCLSTFLPKGEISCSQTCIQGCFDLAYRPKISSIDLRPGTFLLNNMVLNNFTADFIKENVAVVNFFFPFSNFIGLMRTPYVGTTDAVSNFGGLAALLGFSFIAGAEIAYYLAYGFIQALCKWFSTKIAHH